MVVIISTLKDVCMKLLANLKQRRRVRTMIAETAQPLRYLAFMLIPATAFALLALSRTPREHDIAFAKLGAQLGGSLLVIIAIMATFEGYRILSSNKKTPKLLSMLVNASSTAWCLGYILILGVMLQVRDPYQAARNMKDLNKATDELVAYGDRYLDCLMERDRRLFDLRVEVDTGRLSKDKSLLLKRRLDGFCKSRKKNMEFYDRRYTEALEKVDRMLGIDNTVY